MQGYIAKQGGGQEGGGEVAEEKYGSACEGAVYACICEQGAQRASRCAA